MCADETVFYSDVDVDLFLHSRGRPPPPMSPSYDSFARAWTCGLEAFKRSGAHLLAMRDPHIAINTGTMLLKPDRAVHASGMAALQSLRFNFTHGFNLTGRPRDVLPIAAVARADAKRLKDSRMHRMNTWVISPHLPASMALARLFSQPHASDEYVGPSAHTQRPPRCGLTHSTHRSHCIRALFPSCGVRAHFACYPGGTSSVATATRASSSTCYSSCVVGPPSPTRCATRAGESITSLLFISHGARRRAALSTSISCAMPRGSQTGGMRTTPDATHTAYESSRRSADALRRGGWRRRWSDRPCAPRV